jgi:hypothetical protein
MISGSRACRRQAHNSIGTDCLASYRKSQLITGSRTLDDQITQYRIGAQMGTVRTDSSRNSFVATRPWRARTSHQHCCGFATAASSFARPCDGTQEAVVTAPLNGLHDFYHLPPLARTPHTIEWYLLFGVAGFLPIWFIICATRSKFASRYRREAVRELATTPPEEFSSSLKRVALALSASRIERNCGTGESAQHRTRKRKFTAQWGITHCEWQVSCLFVGCPPGIRTPIC